MIGLSRLPAGVAAAPVGAVIDEAAVDEMRRPVEVVDAAAEAGVDVVSERAVDHRRACMEHRDWSPSLAAGPGEDQVLDDGVGAFAVETHDGGPQALGVDRGRRQSVSMDGAAEPDRLLLGADVELVVRPGRDLDDVAIT